MKPDPEKLAEAFAELEESFSQLRRRFLEENAQTGHVTLAAKAVYADAEWFLRVLRGEESGR